MRTALKRIFRRKTTKKKKGPGSREPTDNTTPDEAADSRPVSLFQPKQGRSDSNKASSSTVNSSFASTNSKAAGRQTEAKSSSVSSIIAPIREEFDQASETFSRKSPPTVTEKAKAEKELTAEIMQETIDDASNECLANGAINDEPASVANNYDSIPVLEQTKLPRGGVSVETQAVGRVQYGIPPETIKDSMKLGIPVPQVYIVPVDRFCRELGPALGVNLAEFEFPGYFNFFICKKKCMLVVDSDNAEENIRRVFSETLLGPAQFRREENPIPCEEEDFATDFPREAMPNFQKELEYFRIMPGGHELVCETLLSFCHFENRSDGHENLGVPPSGEDGEEIHDEERELLEMEEDEQNEIADEVKELAGAEALEKMEKKSKWTYSKARFMGDVATVWPFSATQEEIKNRSVPRVEIFKMPGGTEYIVHDIDVNNHIIGKARILGHVKVSEAMSVDGFGGHNFLDDVHKKTSEILAVPRGLPPPSFYPPSFGVTILGNSHGFDASGSVSGYVLWINGRGVMIDPPPYSSATLEREGIRPRMIVGIILTHCHADHDAGAFQKVLAGQPVVVITTPTIYKSFIRKYAALSALSPALLRHSHRYKPAIIGEPLRFQGASFHFVYSLHAIPCLGFRVEWRGRSMVFTGDHMNIPDKIQELQDKGVMTKARADDLRNLPLQDTDLLLHESGAPPIHTPLDVLLKLPKKVKDRLYVVHTSALPTDCELKVAPTGTKGTIRLDQTPQPQPNRRGSRFSRPGLHDLQEAQVAPAQADDSFKWHGHSEYENTTDLSDSSFHSPSSSLMSSFAHGLRSSGGSGGKESRNSLIPDGPEPPLVSLRPASSTDAWFILNLLSAVPFLSSLSYSYAMEVLETARVDAYAKNDIIVPASRRKSVLCVVWEGICSERKTQCGFERRTSNGSVDIASEESNGPPKVVWYAGDWTGPIALQPERKLSGESKTSSDHDIIALSKEGAKVITVEFSNLHSILKAGSPLYHRYLDRKLHQERVKMDASQSISERQSEATPTEQMFEEAIQNLNVLELLNCNSALRKLTAVQKRHLECLAEGPIIYQPGDRLWRGGTPVDKAFLIVSGTASFVPKRRNAGSAAAALGKDNEKDRDKIGDPSVGDSMRADAAKAMKELGMKHGDDASMSSVESNEVKGPQKPPNITGQHIQYDKLFNKSGKGEDTVAVSELHDYAKLSRGLQKRADYLLSNDGSVASGLSGDDSDLDSMEFDNESQLDYTFTDETDPGSRSRRSSVVRRRSSRARFANKVLGRLYSRRAFTGGLVFSRGHFLGDVSKMVAGLLSNDASEVDDDYGHSYGFGDKSESHTDNVLETITELIINEQEGDHQVVHSSTLTAGKEGCVVLVFSKSALIPFMDEFPGLLLSLLGTQVVI